MTPWVRRLLYANVAMFFLQYTRAGFTDALVLVPALALTRPWTIVTYMFLHGSISHILFNMIALYFFGPRVEAQMGERRFITLYMVGGISGAIFSFLFAPRAGVVGASAAIYGVMLAFAMFWPRDKIYIWGVLGIEARWFVVATTAYALYSGLNGSAGGVADFAHLGGYAGAYLYLRLVGSQRAVKQFRKRVAGEVPDGTLRNWRAVDPTRIHALNRDEVNRILDKISASGLSSLTPQEKLFLSNFVPMDDRGSGPPVS